MLPIMNNRENNENYDGDYDDDDSDYETYADHFVFPPLSLLSASALSHPPQLLVCIPRHVQLKAPSS